MEVAGEKRKGNYGIMGGSLGGGREKKPLKAGVPGFF